MKGDFKMKELTVKQAARQLMKYRDAINEIREKKVLRVLDATAYDGIHLSSKAFLDLQKDTGAEISWSGRNCSDYPMQVTLTYEGHIFFAILTSKEIKKMKEMGFEVNVREVD